MVIRNPSLAPLRIGLLIDSYEQPGWVTSLISRIENSGYANVALIISNTFDEPSSTSPLLRIWSQRKYLLYRAYCRLDGWWFRQFPDAFERCDLRTLGCDYPVLSVRPVRKKFSDYFREEDIVQIRAYRLDVALRFGFRILRGKALKIARYGVWSYHHGDNMRYRGGPPGFWEVVERNPVTGSVLQILTEELDGGEVIYRSYAPTVYRSVWRNKNRYYWKSAAFVLRKLKELYEEGPGVLKDSNDCCQNKPYSGKLYRKPSNGEFLPYLIRFLSANAIDKARDLVLRKQWFLAFHMESSKKQAWKPLHQYKPVHPPSDRYWADPFPVKVSDKFFVFLEEFAYRRRKGHISVMEMDARGHFSAPYTVLEREHHLSYPFVFQWKGEFYMIPESAEKRRVDLYRCVSFPHHWVQEATLLEGVRAADATLAEVEGRWWMFVNIAEDGASTFDELFLFYAESPLGPWKPHRRNPVKSDCRSARPAGNLLRFGNRLYRPSQDCSVHYGHSISMNRVRKITPEAYVETEVSKIYPQWQRNLLATHTINRCGNLTIVDGLRRVARKVF